MYSELRHASLVSLDRLDGLGEANIPEADLSIQAAIERVSSARSSSRIWTHSPVTNSRFPPRCICALLIHERWWPL